MFSILKNISIFSLVSIFTASISFLLLPILTSYLTTSDYGLLSLFNATVRLFSVLIAMGMSHFILIELIKNKQRFKYFLRGFIFTTVIITILLTVIVSLRLVFSDDLFGLPKQYVVFLPLVALMVVYHELFINVLIYLKKTKHYVVFTLGKFFIEIIGVLFFIVVLTTDWKGRVAALLIALITSILFSFKYLAKNKLIDYSLKIKTKKYASFLLKKGSPLVFMSLAIMVIDLSDRFFIEHYSSISDTGIYGVAATLSGLILMIIGILLNVIRPMIYETLKEQIKNKKKIIKLGIIYHALLFIAVATLFLIMPYIINVFLDAKFSSAIDYTYFLIPGLFFWGSYHFFLSFILYKQDNLTNGVIAVIGITTNIFLNYFLIQKYGAIGAAESTLYTYFLMFLITVLVLISRKYILINTK